MIKETIARLLADAGVAAIVAGRIQPGTGGEKPLKPYVVIQRVGREENSTADGPGLDIPTLQIDGYADSYLEAEDLSDAIIAALNGQSGAFGSRTVLYCALQDSETSFEKDAQLHRVRNDFRLTAR